MAPSPTPTAETWRDARPQVSAVDAAELDAADELPLCPPAPSYRASYERCYQEHADASPRDIERCVLRALDGGWQSQKPCVFAVPVVPSACAPGENCL